MNDIENDDMNDIKNRKTIERIHGLKLILWKGQWNW